MGSLKKHLASHSKTPGSRVTLGITPSHLGITPGGDASLMRWQLSLERPGYSEEYLGQYRPGIFPLQKNSKRRQADEPYSGISELKIPGGSFGNGPEGRGKEQRLGSHRGDDDAPSADFASARGCCGSLSGSLQVLLLWLEPTGPPDHAGGESTA